MATHNLTNTVIADLNGLPEGVVFPGSLQYVKNYTPNSFALSAVTIADVGPGGGSGGNVRPSSGFIYPRGIC